MADPIPDEFRQALSLTNLRPALQAAVEALRADAAEQGKDDADHGEEAAAAFTRWFSPDAVEQQVLNQLRRRYDKGRLAGFIAAYSSPSVTRMQALEVEADQPAAEAARKAFVEGLSRQQPSPARVDLASRLDAATGQSAAVAEIMFEWTTLLAEAVMQRQPEPERLTELKSGLLRKARDEAIASALFAYRDVSDDDLAAYARLHEQSDVHDFYMAVCDALVNAFRDGFVGFLRERNRPPVRAQT